MVLPKVHHALLLQSDSLSIDAALTYYPECETFEVERYEWPQIGIDEVRLLIVRASLRPATHTAKLLVVATAKITTEAQHAFLKILEEPPSTTYFLLLFSSGVNLLPTVLSRVQLLTSSEEQLSMATLASFQKLSVADRLAKVTEALKKDDESWIRALLREVAVFAATDPQAVPALSTYQLITEAFPKRGAGHKWLLEELALTLPSK